MIELPKTVAGMDEETTAGLALFISVSVQNGLEKWDEKRADADCPRDCEDLKRVDGRVESVHRWVFGRTEENAKLRGADVRLEDVEKFVAGVNRLKWLIITGIVTGVGSTIVGLVLLVASLGAKS